MNYSGRQNIVGVGQHPNPTRNIKKEEKKINNHKRNFDKKKKLLTDGVAERITPRAEKLINYKHKKRPLT